jgi:hypothetical protein
MLPLNREIQAVKQRGRQKDFFVTKREIASRRAAVLAE